MWRLFYPRTEFEYQAEALLKEGVKFPSDIYYFKKYETYLKSPKDKSRFPNINLQESNDSPDNLFEGYQSEFEVLQKTERGLEEFEIIKKDFQRYLFFSDGNIIGNKQFTKIMDKLQESAKKAFKMMEMVMHATLDEKVYHKFMSFLFENNDFCEEVIEDFKQMSNNTLNQAVFIAKYRTNMSRLIFVFIFDLIFFKKF